MSQNLSNKYSQKLVNSAEKPTADAIKTASERAIQKTAEATGDLIGNKMTDKIKNVSKKSPKELHSQNEDELGKPKKSYVSREKRQQIIDELRLV